MFWLFGTQAQASTFTPAQGTSIAAQFDQLYGFLIVVSLIACVLVIGGMIYFAFRYRRRTENDKTPYIAHNALLEFLWSFIPFVIFLVVFGWGWFIYHGMRTMPKQALEIQVQGQKWAWNFLYRSGRTTGGEFWVPVNRPVKLIMSSPDVIHSFFIPAFRIKQDVVPGRYTALWFEANKMGTFHVFCTEFCGTGHSSMSAKLHVVSQEEFDQWLQQDLNEGKSLTEVGQTLFKGLCVACHNTSEVRNIGPGLAKVFGKQRTFSNAGPVTADEDYLRESILNPNAKTVEGYPAGLMPTFAGQLKENEVLAIIEYIKSLQ